MKSLSAAIRLLQLKAELCDQNGVVFYFPRERAVGFLDDKFVEQTIILTSLLRCSFSYDLLYENV